MEKFIYYNDLFSIYKELLTSNEKDIFSSYYEDDLSMSEIALNKGVSRSCIGMTVKKVEKKLENYENMLHIYDKNKKILEISKKISDSNIREELRKVSES